MMKNSSDIIAPQATPSSDSEKGIILADPKDLRSNRSFQEVLEVSEFLNQAENKVQIQFPNKYSEYAWINMSKYYPTAQVSRKGQPSPLPYAVDQSIGEIQYRNKKAGMISVNEHFSTKPIDAMVVVKEGKIIYERYKTMRPEDKHIWYSVSKVTGSTMMAMLEQEGKVDLNLPVSHYLPELEGAVWDTVKVVEAMDMATGLNGTEHDEEIQNSRTDPDQIWYRWAATSAVGLVPDVRERNESWVDVLRDMQRKTPGHQKFEYNSINTFVMNRIVERIADKPLNELYSEKIWSKAGMEHDTYYLESPSGNTLGFLGINATLRDLARWGMVFTPSCEQIAGEKIISDAIMEKIYDRTYVNMYDKGWIGKKNTISFYDDAGKISNRYQWDAVLSDGDLFKAGVGGQGVYISPQNDMVVAWFSTSDGDNQEEAMARAIVKSVSGHPISQ
ncbi:serine hydrolase domain-containing protein [Persicobacter diffluens]|uniref:Beta-lactamase-related domain-containing protein n=1 Tax=Persicobacter diffluens TaxID=981 RepID=A0AAN4W455_9BACT|nr:hypothetical protein PEDI_51010 [Persicobacter diffluens]